MSVCINLHEMSQYTSLFISHGGGPLPLLEDEGHVEMVKCLGDIAQNIQKPAAIVMVSAHWEEDIPTVTSQTHPSLIYDYFGFPEEAYRIQYPAVGAPKLADKLINLLTTRDIPVAKNETRGFDHGMFVPLKIMYPDADVPCVQLSLKHNLNAEQHIQIGKALSSLHTDNVLVVGSGFTFHNMKTFSAANDADTQMKNQMFEFWLEDTCTSQTLNENTRQQRLINWAQAPHARYCHPREEHLLPLHVCYGVAQHAVKKAYSFKVMGLKTSCYIW